MPRRQRKHPQRATKTPLSDSSSSDQSRHLDKRICKNNKVELNLVTNDSENNSGIHGYSSVLSNSYTGITGMQYTGPMTSSPIGYQPQQFQSYQPPPPPMHPPPTSPGIETWLKELCQRMANVESKLSALDQIGSRLDKMEKNYGKVDTDILDCKNRIGHLEKVRNFCQIYTMNIKL